MTLGEKSNRGLGVPTGPRTTADVEMLAIEADLAADGKTGNWARPLDDDTEAKARRRIEADGNTPAWEV